MTCFTGGEKFVVCFFEQTWVGRRFQRRALLLWLIGEWLIGEWLIGEWLIGEGSGINDRLGLRNGGERLTLPRSDVVVERRSDVVVERRSLGGGVAAQATD